MMYESLYPVLSAESYSRLLEGLAIVVSLCLVLTLLTFIWLGVVLIYCQWRSDADSRRREGWRTRLRDLESHA